MSYDSGRGQNGGLTGILHRVEFSSYCGTTVDRYSRALGTVIVAWSWQTHTTMHENIISGSPGSSIFDQFQIHPRSSAWWHRYWSSARIQCWPFFICHSMMWSGSITNVGMTEMGLKNLSMWTSKSTFNLQCSHRTSGLSDNHL